MNEEEKLISIIIPTYGRPDYLIRAIKSVQNQSYKNIEIIIVDDNGKGSKNQLKTQYKMKNYIEKDIKLNYIVHDKNLNGSAARNTGLKHSNGEYICFLDDDDEFLTDKLKKQYQKLEKLDSEWVACYTGHSRVFNNNQKENYEYSPTKEGDILYQILTFKIDHVSGSSLMVKKDTLIKINGWNTRLDRHQDYEFIAKIADQGKIAVISEPQVIIHVHSGSNREKKFKKIEYTRLKYLESIQSYIDNLRLNEKRTVLYLNYYWLLKKAIQHKKIDKIFHYYKKCRKPFITLKMLVTDSLTFLTK